MFMFEVISVPGVFFLSSAILSMAPCQGLLWAILPMCSPAAFAPPRHHSCPCSLSLFATPKFVAGVSSCIPLVWFALAFLFVQDSLACCSIRSWHFSALPACNTSAGQAWEHFSSIIGQEAQQSKFCSQKICLSLICVILLKTTQSVAHLFLFRLWPTPILILQFSGSRDCLVYILTSAFCGLAFARLQEMFWFFKQNWRMH